MPSFADSIFLFVLALLLFGPKRLPVLARELGKWMGEFRRASNEFKMQMEDELRASEQAEQQKRIAAMEAAAPPPPAVETDPSVQHFGHGNQDVPLTPEPEPAATSLDMPAIVDAVETVVPAEPALAPAEPAAEPLPIAESGEFKMMPPATGLPRGRSRGSESALNDRDPFGGLIESIPEAASAEQAAEEATHGH